MRHVLRNILPTVAVYSTLLVGDNLVEAALSFLGLGVQPTSAQLGNMVSDRAGPAAADPAVAVATSRVAALVTVVGFNLLGDGLRDALDPRLRGRVWAVRLRRAGRWSTGPPRWPSPWSCPRGRLGMGLRRAPAKLEETRLAVDAVAPGACRTRSSRMCGTGAVEGELVARLLAAAGRIDVLLEHRRPAWPARPCARWSTSRTPTGAWSSPSTWTAPSAQRAGGAGDEAGRPSCRSCRRHPLHTPGRSYSLTGIQAYASAKAGLIGLTRQTARELRARGDRETRWPRLLPLEPGHRAAMRKAMARRAAAPAGLDRPPPGSAGRRTWRTPPCSSSPPTMPACGHGQPISVDGGHWMLDANHLPLPSWITPPDGVAGDGPRAAPNSMNTTTGHSRRGKDSP